MEEIQTLEKSCMMQNVSFSYTHYFGQYIMDFGISKDTIRKISGLWNLIPFDYPKTFVQLLILETGPVLRILGDEIMVQKLSTFFLHPILPIDLVSFEVMSAILVKIREENVLPFPEASFFHGNENYPYLLKIPNYDFWFQVFYLRNLRKCCIDTEKSCFGFKNFEEVIEYEYHLYTESKFQAFAKTLIPKRKR